MRLAALHAPAEPVGFDAYFHFIQVRSLVAEGRLHAPDASWVLRAFALGHALGLSERLAVEAVAALLAAACVPAAWWLARRWQLGATAAWLLAGWAAGSPVLTHLAADFPKNLGIAAPWLALLSLSPQRRGEGQGEGPAAPSRAPGQPWYDVRPLTPTLSPALRGEGACVVLVMILLAVAGAGAHRTGVVLVLLWLVGTTLGLLGARASPRALRLAALGAGAVVLAAVVLAFVPGVFQLADLERATTQLSATPSFPPPPWPYFALRTTLPLFERLELLAAWPALLLALVRWVRVPRERPLLTPAVLLLLTASFPFWRTDALDLGWRLALLAPLAALPVLATALPRRDLRWPVAVAFLLLPLAWLGVDRAAAPPWERYHQLVAAIPRPLPALAIAHQGLASRYDFDTGSEALPWAPEPELDRATIFRIAFEVRDREWAAFLPETDGAPRPMPLGQGAVWIREDVWEAFVQRARAEGDDDLRARLDGWRNPSQVRPAWLRPATRR